VPVPLCIADAFNMGRTNLELGNLSDESITSNLFRRQEPDEEEDEEQDEEDGTKNEHSDGDDSGYSESGFAQTGNAATLMGWLGVSGRQTAAIAISGLPAYEPNFVNCP
jgi:ABC-type Zn2+ transport system substrate-binding protein/surface adhesin